MSEAPKPQIMAIVISTVASGALGKAYDRLDNDSLFVFVIFSMALLSAFLTSVLSAKWTGTPGDESTSRFGNAAGLGGLAGLSLTASCWSSMSTISYFMMGLFAGLVTAIPVAVTYGMAGGASRPLDSQEMKTLAMNLGIVVALALVMSMLAVVDDEGDGDGIWAFLRWFGFAGNLVLLPAGRFSFAENFFKT